MAEICLLHLKALPALFFLDTHTHTYNLYRQTGIQIATQVVLSNIILKTSTLYLEVF